MDIDIIKCTLEIHTEVQVYLNTDHHVCHFSWGCFCVDIANIATIRFPYMGRKCSFLQSGTKNVAKYVRLMGFARVKKDF